MISQLDKRYYDKFIDTHDKAQHVVENASEQFYDLVDCLYKGAIDEASTDVVQALSEVNNIRAMQTICRGNGWRAVDTAASILYSGETGGKDLDGGIDDMDFKSSLQNFYTSELFIQEMKETKEGQNQTDLLVSKSEGAGLTEEPSKEEIEFRNWLQNKVSNDSNIKEIMKWFGNFYAHANRLKRKSYNRSSEIQDVTVGRNIPDVVPSQYANLGIEELEVLFDHDFANKQLLEYDRTKKSSGKQGPVVLALDQSKSMDEKMAGGHSKANIAIGFTMAVVKVMDDDDRRCEVFTFRMSTRDIISGDESLSTKFKSLLRLSPSGSTSLTNAIKHGCKISDKDDDLIVVTDGIDRNIVPKEVNKTKGERRVSTLLVSEYKPDSTAMSDISDSFIVANDSGGFDKLMSEVIN